MNRYVFYVALDRFYVQSLAEREPDLDGRPLVLVHQKTIFDVNIEARKMGVLRGTPLPLARTLMGPKGVVRTWCPDDYADLQTKWLDLCAEFSGEIEPEAQHAAYLDLSNHPDPAYIARALVERLQGATKYTLRFGAGATKWVAKAAAIVEGGQFSILEPADLAELKVDYLSPIEPGDRERLQFLGYRKIGDVLEVPLNVLKEQFGDEGYRIHQAVRGVLPHRVVPSYPRDSMVECLIFNGEVDSLLTIDESLADMAQRLGTRLQARNAQATEVVGEIEVADGRRESWRRKFSKPVRDPRTARTALSLLFADHFDAPVHAVHVRFSKLERVRNVQTALIRNEKTPQIDSALAQVRAVFGETSVQFAGEMVLPRRVRLLKEWQRATGWN